MANRAGKGSTFERDICRQLTAWWTGDPAADVIFWRTSQSGGRATTRRKSGRAAARAHCGDLAALDPSGEPFTRLITPELKRGYRTATLHEMLDLEKPVRTEYGDWIVQARRASAAAQTPYWAIIHRRDRRTAMIVLPGRFLRDLGYRAPIESFPLPVFECAVEVWSGVKPNREMLRIRLVVMRLEAFLGKVTPAAIRALGEQHADARKGT